MLLRFEVDACTSGPTSSPEDDLSAAFSSLGVASESSPPISGVTVQKTTPRVLVPQTSLIELKTRVSHKALDWVDTYPQLYLSQTTYLYLAKHTRGSFNQVEKFALTGQEMKPHARRAEQGMGRLVNVLAEILTEVRKQETGTLMSLLCVGKKLSLHKRTTGTGIAVGEEIMSRFK